MRYEITDYDGEDYYIAFVGYNKDALIKYLMERIGDLQLDVY